MEAVREVESLNPIYDGRKESEGKSDWTLLGPLWPQLEEVVRRLEHGVNKYERNNWMRVEPLQYYRAVMSHYSKMAGGEWIDPDSGFSHASAIICDALFIMWQKENLNADEKRESELQEGVQKGSQVETGQTRSSGTKQSEKGVGFGSWGPPRSRSYRPVK